MAFDLNIKNKEQTKQRLIRAVGEVLKADGYSGLGVNRIAKQAGVNKKLIYRYFGSVDYLIEAYVVENDYWLTFSKKLQEMVAEEQPESTQALIAEILKNQFKYFLNEREMQRLILWEISTNSPLMKSIHNARESSGQSMLAITDEHFSNSKINFRAIAALLVGGIYYTILHTRFNGGMFCDLDLSTELGQREILTAIEQIVGWAFDYAKTEQ
ncbi:TetR/AcrR family transcriptional regulator [Mucilaginibacter segetis]|uniref:TetR/AcrR family transcriptional regulator n=1 Tax=Mucilaginibacter segetis TaxID=2793071 RepID=A0A934UM17_9SPHI|nr:TetR/AcrR family transcriptional regulator [Mucilaginibacter segetis]MBK0378550.1 TetR/AcrR family transcriptional regulator [Mucilaginibacter segetis]